MTPNERLGLWVLGEGGWGLGLIIVRGRLGGIKACTHRWGAGALGSWAAVWMGVKG